MNYIIIQTAVGKIGLAEEGTQLVRVFFGDRPPINAKKWETPFLTFAAEQFEQYLDGHRTDFDIKFHSTGTPFQMAVWDALQAIPFGETRSYKDIAVQIGRTTSCRAVGGAVHVNPLPIIVPCHRVIGSDGSLTGFAGGLELKKMLLELEKK